MEASKLRSSSSDLMAAAGSSHSERKYQPNAGFHSPETFRIEASHPLYEPDAIKAGHLGYDDHGFFAQAGFGGVQMDVARRIGEPEIRGEGHAQDGADSAPIEAVRLDYQDRTPESRFAPERDSEICPPDLTTSHLR